LLTSCGIGRTLPCGVNGDHIQYQDWSGKKYLLAHHFITIEPELVVIMLGQMVAE
jgi:hypothetical protein